MVERLNLVCKENAVTPNYDLGNRETYITLYFTLTNEVVIAGEVDNNYIYWLSITKTGDTETNEQIFNHIASGAYQYVSNMHLALRQAGLEYSVLRDYYAARLTREKTGDMAWRTPFGHSYGKSESNGRYFARDVSGFVCVLRRRCEIRQAGGAYQAVLQAYADSISAADDMDYGLTVKPVAELLAKERYLAISPDRDVRELYRRCCDLCAERYNAYMTAVR